MKGCDKTRSPADIARLALELILLPDSPREAGVWALCALNDDLRPLLGHMTKGPVGVDNAQRIVGGVHNLATGQQVSHNGQAQVGDQKTHSSGQKASRPTRTLLCRL